MSFQRRFCRGLLLLAVLTWPAYAQSQTIPWRGNFEAAKAEAGQSGRLVLVHVWTEDCAPCIALEQNVFSQPGVAGALEAKFVPVKLNANENPAMATGMGVTRVPTDVVLDAKGQVVGRLISPATPMAYIAELTRVANDYASQSGRALDDVVATAPHATQLNSAYTDLDVTPWTPPAVPQASQVGARYAASAPIGVPPALPSAASSLPAGVGPAASSASGSTATTMQPTPSVVDNRYAQATASMPPSAASPGLGTTDRYPAGPPQTPTVASPGASAQMMPADRQITTNQYAASPASSAPLQTATASAPTRSAAAPDPSRLPPGAPPLGFDGYCPVSMRGVWQWVPGDPQYGAIHRGRTYWFTGAREQQQFLANPDYYSPALSGIDPVMAIEHHQQVPGRREHSIDYDNLFYMFSSEASLQQFTANPERYAAGVRQAMGIARGGAVR